ncbi:MAG: ImmA/IrrE family metallo-endopeptidase [Magnetococcales bacterium]|nr:ImmA/IrrE family metallo-endopeptidase [Magnetococcales bacterium]MBF0151392.1 ImmA/IrrE family metallo-endopeptidase [Magnetococcales bacterium]
MLPEKNNANRKNKAMINPAMLRWARQRIAWSEEHLAQKVPTRVDRLRTWEQGEDFPTFRQAETIAKKTHIPLGYLFLSDPPDEVLPIPDLRSLGGIPLEKPSATLFDLIQDVRFQHDWYRDYLLQQGAERLPFVGKYTLKNKIQDIANDIRSTLAMDDSPTSKNWEEHLSQHFDRCEEAGIWVMRSGHVGSNTKRTLDVQEFRGFAISDPIIPLIFINGKDAKAAQFFTLAHELAHIWLGANGISNIPLDEISPKKNAGIEWKCNAIAAEVLTPQSIFLDLWNDGHPLEENILALSKHFMVSGIVIARRAYVMGKTTHDKYIEFLRKQQKEWKTKEEKFKEQDGGDFFRTAPIKNGRRFTDAVLANAMTGTLLLRDAGELLHMKPSTLQKLFQYR